MKAPNFFLAGASKAGTTSLYEYLRQHPQIFMCPMKEPHFLADEVRKENFADEMRTKIEQWEMSFREYLRGPVSERFPSGPLAAWEDYLSLFHGARDEVAVGEASPCYLWSKTAPGNIVRRFPDAKVIVVLRKPVERAFAQHLHTLSVANHPLSFREHMDAALGLRDKRIGELYPFLEFGSYGEQLARYFEVLPRDRVGVFFYEDFQQDAFRFLRGIFRFLGVEEGFTPDLRARHMESRVPRWFGLNRSLRASGLREAVSRLAPQSLRRALRPIVFRHRGGMALELPDRARLVDYYRDDLRKLGGLLDRDLAGWMK